MFLDYEKIDQIFIICGTTYLRKGIDGLDTIVQHAYNLEGYQKALFLFFGGRNDRFKMLYYNQNGSLLLYKRLDKGKFQWPKKKQEVRRLPHQQIRWLMEGLSIEQPRAIQKGKREKF